MSEILIIDDEAGIRELIADILKDEGYKVSERASAGEAIAYFEAGNTPNAVILDIWLEGSEMDGIGVLKYIKSHYSHIPVIMISGHGNIETAVQTIKLGAYDFIEKPFKSEKLLILLARAVEVANLAEENLKLKPYQENTTAELIGNSKAAQNLKASALLAAPTNSRIIIMGSSGSGKEVLARFIHNNSKRARKPFNAISMQNHNPEQLEAFLFGSDNKANRKIGILEKVDGGTLYIDEISDMPTRIQTKFLKFLQTSSFQRIESNKEIRSDIRIIAGSSKNLELEINNGKLNSSLFYRLNVVPLRMLTIAERKEDIKQIAQYFCEYFSSILSIPLKNLTNEAINVMYAYDWPGNVRQISNVIEWIYIMTPQGIVDITAEMLPQEVITSINEKHKNLNPVNADILSKELKKARELFEREYLVAQLNRFSGNISRTANFIGMDRTALHRKIKSLSIRIPADECGKNDDEVSNY